MKASIEKALSSTYSTMINNRFNEMVESAAQRGSSTINSKAFFMKVINNYFEEMSAVKANKCEKESLFLTLEVNKAVEKAEYACAKPAREENRKYWR